MFDVIGFIVTDAYFIIQVHARFNSHAYFSDNVTVTDMIFIS